MICFFVNELLNIYNSERLAKNPLIVFRLLLIRAERNMCVLIAIGSFNYTNYAKNKKILAPMRFSFSFAFNRSSIAFFFNWLLKKAMFRLLLTRAERNMCVLIAIGSFNHTNYTKNKKNIGPDAIRTHDLWFRKPLLYPAELRGHY